MTRKSNSACSFIAPLLAGGLVLLSAAAHANLLVNGGFEASSSNVITPTGWFNVGHTEGVLQYAQVPMQPVHEGLNFYSIGGVGSNGFASIGEGIGQTFATVVGASYRVSYAYSGENVPGVATETLRVSAGSSFVDHVLVPTGGPAFTRPWAVGGLDFVASANTTKLSFILAAGTGPVGNNDPLIVGVGVLLTAVPESQSWALMLAGLAGLARVRSAAGKRAVRPART